MIHNICSTAVLSVSFLLLYMTAASQTNVPNSLRKIISIESPALHGQGGYTTKLGDINGDGWPDFAVSAEYDDMNQTRIFYGGPGILDDKWDDSVAGGKNAIAGDFNGDGFTDLVCDKSRTGLNDGNEDTLFFYMGRQSPGLRLDTIPAFKFPGGTACRIPFPGRARERGGCRGAR